MGKIDNRWVDCSNQKKCKMSLTELKEKINQAQDLLDEIEAEVDELIKNQQS